MYFDAKEFGKRLHDVRTSRGITQEELAVRLGLASKQHVSRMENGERSCSSHHDSTPSAVILHLMLFRFFSQS